MMMYKVDINESLSSGVVLKMNDQKRAFENLGHEVIVGCINANKISIDDKLIEPDNKPSSFYIKNVIFFKSVSNYLKKQKFDIIYIRYPYSSHFFIKFLAQQKKDNPTCSLIIEVPTYPFHKEFKGIKKIGIWMDFWYRRKLKKYVDCIVLIGQNHNLWGINTIPISNGIDVKRISPSCEVRKEGIVRLLAVGNWHEWHGLDRLIKGLGDYYAREPNVLIKLNVVGVGERVDSYIRLVHTLNLEDYVFFHRNVNESNLVDFYKSADIGIGTLGNHRIGLTSHAPLKHREYCAYGLPFILSTPDVDFPDYLDFVQYQPADESNINCDTVVGLYKKTLNSHSKVRQYALQMLSWDKRMEDILNQCKNKNIFN
ncbi:MAG: glycosyltransferase family 4 protein [Saprospiraceae bacterium]|nr:glycosyltransferase family 4 protein [Saprospiraceae bacterium]